MVPPVQRAVVPRAAIGVLVAGFFLILASAGASLAQSPPTVPPELVISGRLGSEASGLLRLEAASEATEVVLVANGLKLTALAAPSSEPSAVDTPAAVETPVLPVDDLGSTAVSFSESPISLEPGKPTFIVVTAKGFRYAGMYTGEIQVLYAAPPPEPSPPGSPVPYEFLEYSDAISLTVNVSADPSIALAIGSLPIKIVKTRCSQGWECDLARFWADDAELQDSTFVALRNTGQVEGRVTGLSSTITNRATRTPPAGSPVGVTMVSDRIAAGGVSTLDVRVERSMLDAGLYDGLVTFVSKGVPGTTALAFDLTVREPPLQLAIWIGAGWLVVFGLERLRSAAKQVRVADVGRAELARLESDYPDDIGRVKDRITLLMAKTRWSAADDEKAKTIASDLVSLDIVTKLKREIGSMPGFDDTNLLISTTRDLVARGRSKEAADKATAAIVAKKREEAGGPRAIDGDEVRRGGLTRALDVASVIPAVIAAILSRAWSRIEAPVIRLSWFAVRIGAFAVLIALGLKLAYSDTAGFTGATLKDWLVLVTFGSGAEALSKYVSGLIPRPSV